MAGPATRPRKGRRWVHWTTTTLVLVIGIAVFSLLLRKARLIRHIDEVGGFFYSYHPPMVKKLLGKKRHQLKRQIVPRLEPVFGRNWPGLFKEITHVEIDLRNGGSEWDLDVLRHQGKITWLDIGELEVTDEEITVLETLPALHSLNVNISRLGPEGFASLESLESVRFLALSGRELSAAEARIISRMELDLLMVERPEAEFEDPGVAAELANLKDNRPSLELHYAIWFYP